MSTQRDKLLRLKAVGRALNGKQMKFASCPQSTLLWYLKVFSYGEVKDLRRTKVNQYKLTMKDGKTRELKTQALWWFTKMTLETTLKDLVQSAAKDDFKKAILLLLPPTLTTPEQRNALFHLDVDLQD